MKISTTTDKFQIKKLEEENKKLKVLFSKKINNLIDTYACKKQTKSLCNIEYYNGYSGAVDDIINDLIILTEEIWN